MIELIYNPYFFNNFSLFIIMKIQISNILILVDNDFASTKKSIIKLAKIITKDQKYLIFTYFLKLNNA